MLFSNTLRASRNIQLNDSWCATYVIAAMLDDFDKGFSLFAILISSNMAKISLFIESLGDGCTPRILTIHLSAHSTFAYALHADLIFYALTLLNRFLIHPHYKANILSFCHHSQTKSYLCSKPYVQNLLAYQNSDQLSKILCKVNTRDP